MTHTVEPDDLRRRLEPLYERMLVGLDSPELVDKDWLVIDDFGEALIWAARTDTARGHHWLDLREFEARPIHRGRELTGLEDVAVTRATEDLLEERVYPHPIGPEIYDEVDGEIDRLLRLELVGAPPGLFHLLERAYLAGGWPCGWDGEYPNGRLVVYDPGRETG